MDIHNFKLNSVFTNNSRKYQSKPVRAAKYTHGMENGFMLYFANKGTKEREPMLHEGVKFFPTEKEAWDYINADHGQCIKEDGKLIEIPVEYDPPKPVLYRKDNGTGNRGIHFSFETYAFVSDESCDYEFFILEDDCWIIIEEADGNNIRVWYPDSEETFFGREKDIIYEVIGNKYLKIAV